MEVINDDFNVSQKDTTEEKIVNLPLSFENSLHSTTNKSNDSLSKSTLKEESFKPSVCSTPTPKYKFITKSGNLLSKLFTETDNEIIIKGTSERSPPNRVPVHKSKYL